MGDRIKGKLNTFLTRFRCYIYLKSKRSVKREKGLFTKAFLSFYITVEKISKKKYTLPHKNRKESGRDFEDYFEKHPKKSIVGMQFRTLTSKRYIMGEKKRNTSNSS